jgi:hypothetical protein
MKIGGLWSLRSTGMIRIPGRLGPSGAEIDHRKTPMGDSTRSE